VALYHFWQVLVTVLFGGFGWMLCRYLILRVGNLFTVQFPQWASTPHWGFMLAVGHWGLFIIVMLPCAFYLWVQTQRPEVER